MLTGETGTATVAANVEQVRKRVRAAAERAGRDPDLIRIVGVTKTLAADANDIVVQAFAAGLRDFGENRVQDAARKVSAALKPALEAGAHFHLIGHLQTNKARDAVRLFSLIHSVDRTGLVDALQRRAEREGKRQDILLQVNVAREEQKHGCAPEDAEGLLEYAAQQPNLRVRGLMTIAPLVDNPEATRPVFAALRDLRDRLKASTGIDLPELSMGMTNDYEVAIEEGATIIRVGRAIFG